MRVLAIRNVITIDVIDGGSFLLQVTEELVRSIALLKMAEVISLKVTNHISQVYILLFYKTIICK